jgi:hypothetical protein
MKKHCCKNMTDAVTATCDKHPDRFDCPDCLIHYSPKFDEYGIIVHNGGTASVSIAFCPWCGVRLSESKRDLWFKKLEDLGFDDPLGQKIPKQFQSDAWYSQTK